MGTSENKAGKRQFLSCHIFIHSFQVSGSITFVVCLSKLMCEALQLYCGSVSVPPKVSPKMIKMCFNSVWGVGTQPFCKSDSVGLLKACLQIEVCYCHKSFFQGGISQWGNPLGMLKAEDVVDIHGFNLCQIDIIDVYALRV